MVGGGETRNHDSWMREESPSHRMGRRGHEQTMFTLELESEVCGREGIGGMDAGERGDLKLGFAERAFSTAEAVVLSAVIVNPAISSSWFCARLQAQAAGVAHSHPLSNLTSRMAFFGPNMLFADLRCSPSSSRAGIHGTASICPPDCFHYKGTLDTLYRIVRQEGLGRLWRGTNAGLALAVPTVGIYLPCYDIFRNSFEQYTTQLAPGMTPCVPLIAGSLARSLAWSSFYPIELAKTRMQSYRVVWTDMGAQLACDVPFSAICWSILEPSRRKLLGTIGEEAGAVSVFGTNFSTGFIAGSLAAAAACPLDVAKTRRQIENDPIRALTMTTRQTLLEVWRDGGIKGLFTGVGPRVGRAGPSVRIVVSFYEVAKHFLLRQHP